MPSDPTFVYPPLYHHTSHLVSPPSAAIPLAAYLEKSLTRPYLHPDAWLSLEGVRHGPKSGPQGSWALHHLRRIEAGMRGEMLAVESTEELVGKFGEEVVGEAMGVRSFRRKEQEEEEGIGEDMEEGVEDGGEVEDVREKTKQTPASTKPEHLMTKAEKKKARRAAEKAEVARARERGEDVPTYGRKRKRNHNEDHESEAPSEANGYSGAEDQQYKHNTNADINDPSQYQSAQKHALSQKPLLEDMGERDPAGVDRGDAVKAPVVVEHDAKGDVVVPENSSERKQKKKEKEKKKEKKKRKESAGAAEEEEDERQQQEARRAAKKAKREEGKKEKDLDVLMVDAADAAAPTTPSAGAEVGPSRKEKRKKREEEMKGTPVVAAAAAAGGMGKKDVQIKGNGTPATSEKKNKKKAKKVKGEKEASS